MKKESKYAILNFQKQDENLANILAEYLDEKTKKLYDFFGIAFQGEKSNITIVPSKKEFDIIYRKANNKPENEPIQDWIIGTCNNGIIFYVSLNDYDNTAHKFDKKDYAIALENYKKTILHEQVHFVNELFSKQNNSPETIKFLSEGIATYLSGQYENQNVGFYADADTLLNQNKNPYDQYFLITKYLAENFDKETILSLFKNNQTATTFLKTTLYPKAKEHYIGKENSKDE